MPVLPAAEAPTLDAWLRSRLGALLAQTGATLAGSVDRGWRAELFPSRVGARARLHQNNPGRLR
jgi:hypothetical protein